MTGYEVARWGAYFEAKDQQIEKIDLLFAKLYATVCAVVGAECNPEDLLINWDPKPVKVDQKELMMMLATALGAEVRYV